MENTTNTTAPIKCAEERELFEAAMVEAGCPIFERHLFLDGKYLHQRDEDRFVGWKLAARASLGAAQVPDLAKTRGYHALIQVIYELRSDGQYSDDEGEETDALADLVAAIECGREQSGAVSDIRDRLLAALERAGKAETELRALKDSAGAAQVPAGWKLVPLAPTMNMCSAGKEAELHSPTARSALLVYRAMLAAAPEPTAGAARVPSLTFEEWLAQPDPKFPKHPRNATVSARVAADFRTGWDAAFASMSQPSAGSAQVPSPRKFIEVPWVDEPPRWCDAKQEEIWKDGYDTAMSSARSVNSDPVEVSQPSQQGTK